MMKKKKISKITLEFEFELADHLDAGRSTFGLINVLEEAFMKHYGEAGQIKLIGAVADYGKGNEYFKQQQ